MFVLNFFYIRIYMCVYTSPFQTWAGIIAQVSYWKTDYFTGNMNYICGLIESNETDLDDDSKGSKHFSFSK